MDAIEPDQAALALHDDDGEIRVVATHRLLDTYRTAARGNCPWPAGTNPAEPRLVPDILSAPAGSLQNIVAGQQTRALAVIPLTTGTGLLGTLTAYFNERRAWADGEIDRVRALAAQAAGEIQEHRLEAGLRLANLALTATLDAAPDGLTVQGPDGRILFANQDAAAMVGFDTPEDLLAATPLAIMSRFELFDEHGAPLEPRQLPGRHALMGERPPERLVRWRATARPDDERWSIVSARPVFDGDGTVRFVVNVFRDVTERQRATEALRRSERRLSFLAGTSPQLLDSALDYATVLERIADLFVPDLADVCAVRECDGQAVGRRVAASYSPAVGAAVAERLEGPDRLLDELAEQAPLLAPDVAALDDPALARTLARLGLRSALAVPLLASGSPLGDITLLSVDGGRRYDDADLALVEEVARRAGLTAQNARLFQERSAVASTLQRALLPPRLPDLPGVDLAARYHAASSAIGGDFYDVVPVGPSRWVIAVGDVCGKGIEAASLTAMVRYTLRAFARTAASPRELLAQLNDALLPQLDAERFCTVACCLLDLSGTPARLTVALGGHPRPLHVTAGGAVRPVGIPGTLLGTLPDPELSDQDVLLHPGDAVAISPTP